MSEKRATPIRIPLSRVGRELGPTTSDARRDTNGNDSAGALLADAVDDDTRFGAVARELGGVGRRLDGADHRLDGIERRMGALEANQTLTLSEVRRSGQLLARIAAHVGASTDVEESAMREPAPSFNDVSFEDDEEVITAHGTKKYAYSEDALRAKMRAEYMKLQKSTEKKKALVNDARPWRWVKSVFFPMVLGAIVAFAVGAILGALKAAPVTAAHPAPAAPASSAAPAHGGTP